MLRYIILFLFIVHPCSAFVLQQTLYFSFDEFEEPLEGISLKRYNEEDVFLIQGYSDPIGDETYNKYLSKLRSLSIKSKLVSEYNIDESRFKIVANGEDHSPELRNAKKRRVEIITGSPEEIKALLSKTNSLAYRMSSGDEDHESYQGEYLNREEVVENSIKEPEFLPSKEIKKDVGASYQSRHFVGLGVYHNILLATDRGSGGEAEWVSNENYAIEGQYQFKYKKLWLGINSSYHIQDYDIELNPIFTWNEKVPNLLNASFVADYEAKRWGLGFDLDYHQTSFIYEDNFDIELRDVFMLGVSLRGKYKWFSKQKWSSRIGLKLDLPLTGSDEISPKGELGYIGFVDLKRDKAFRNHGLNLKLYYGFRNYTNDQNDQHEETAGILLSVDSLNWL